jgi:hypothetical protein
MDTATKQPHSGALSDRDQKKPYTAPRLTIYGDVAAKTNGTNTNKGDTAISAP